MPRRREVPKRETLPDPIFSSKIHLHTDLGSVYAADVLECRAAQPKEEQQA